MAKKLELDHSEVVSLYLTGLSAQEVGCRVGASRTTITRILKSAGEPIRGNAVPKDTGDKIEDAYRQGVPMQDICSTFGVSDVCVRNQVNKRGGGVRPPSWRKSVAKRDFFRKIETEKQAYWLGFLAADGCVTDSGYVRLALKESDGAHVKAFRDTLGSEHKIQHGKGFVAVTIGCHQLARDLTRLGVCPRKTLTMKVDMDSIPDHLRRHYWRGVVDGDGCWHLRTHHGRPHISVGITGTEDTCVQFLQWSRTTVNTKAKLTEHPSEGIKNACVSGLWVSLALGEELYRDATIFLPRKRNVFEEGLLRAREHKGETTFVHFSALREAFIQHKERLNLGYREIAQQTGMSTNTLCDVGKRNLSEQTYVKLERWLGTPLDTFLVEDGEQEIWLRRVEEARKYLP